MATPVAHGLIGISTLCGFILVQSAFKRLTASKRAIVLAALVANIPDLDMLVNLFLFNDHKILHGDVTHTFAFAGMMTLLVGMATYRYKSMPSVAIMTLFLVTSHVLVDWLTGQQPGLHAAQILFPFWPFSDSAIRLPLTLFKGVNHDDLFPDALFTATFELILLGPMTAVLLRLTSHKFVSVSQDIHR